MRCDLPPPTAIGDRRAASTVRQSRAYWSQNALGETVGLSRAYFWRPIALKRAVRLSGPSTGSAPPTLTLIVSSTLTSAADTRSRALHQLIAGDREAIYLAAAG
jgi:hypothetical protein